MIEISVSEAKAQLTDLVRKAEQGEDVVLTRHGHVVARITGVRSVPTGEARWAILQLASAGAAGALPGPDAARSQDFLYDENGLPG